MSSGDGGLTTNLHTHGLHEYFHSVFAQVPKRALICALLLWSSVPAGAEAPDDRRNCSDALVCLDQGWADHERSWWYSVSQGSRLLPLKWFEALERADSQEKFLSAANVARFGYLPNAKSRDNPFGLPLGFAVDVEEGGRSEVMCDVFPTTCASETTRARWVGMNCAACHTGQITYQGKAIRIEGAPALSDFQTFMDELIEALAKTQSDDAKFSRFANAVIRQGTASQHGALRVELREQVVWLKKVDAKNAIPRKYGYGRLDAQGHILNRLSLVLGASDQLKEFPSDAPVSYPQIWNAPQHDKLQWNGVAENKFRFEIFGRKHDIGALIRNTSEVLGVFAGIDVASFTDKLGYRTSLRLSNMIAIERQLGRLQSPKWPQEILGPIDWVKANRGRDLFEGKCLTCHAHLKSSDVTTPIKADMRTLDDAGTDIWTACNTFLHRSKAGRLEGRLSLVYTGPVIAETDFTRLMLANAAVGSIVGRADELIGTILDDTIIGIGRILPSPPPLAVVPQYLPGVADELKRERARKCLQQANSLLSYKARPLNGIWATAPYLHNGSVPTLYDLLLPSAVRTRIPPLQGENSLAANGKHRPEVFEVGGREFDPVKVGFKPSGNAALEFKVREATGEPILGNYNSGHEGGNYAVDDEADRMSLIEYLKTL